VSPIGDWFLDENDRWAYDPDAPSPSAEVTALPPPEAPAYASVFERPDKEAYGRPDPQKFALFDDVDSTTITDDGGPPDAA
jgi:hypothetical protein